MNIFVLHCGGTISCRLTEDGYLTPSSDFKNIFSETEKEFGSITFYHKKTKLFLSEHLSGDKLGSITAQISEASESGKYDGIIVTLGSDTVAYASAAIGYFLGNLSIPVVTVCSELPADDPGSSASLNIRAATALIASGKEKGVFSVYRKDNGTATVHRATRLMRQQSYSDIIYSAGEEYGKIVFYSPGKAEFVKNPRFSEAESGAVLRCNKFTVFSPVMHLTVSPGMIYPRIPSSVKAVILGTYHSGTLDTQSKKTAKFAKYCKKKKITVFTDSTGTGSDYLSTKKYGELGFFRLPPLVSPAAFYVKLWILLCRDDKELIRQVYTPYAGDIPSDVSGSTDKGGEQNGQ